MERDATSPACRWISLPRDRSLLVELFVCSNLAFLALDVAIAHAVNRFRDPAEWIPVGFAAARRPLALLPGIVALVARRRAARRARERSSAGAPSWSASPGLIFHLRSQFFAATTLHSLVYSAPFVAPLSFAGLGLLLLANRMIPAESPEWPQWVLFLALAGFAGNFALSLTDHAQNGFFNPLEWVPVASSASPSASCSRRCCGRSRAPSRARAGSCWRCRREPAWRGSRCTSGPISTGRPTT